MPEAAPTRKAARTMDPASVVTVQLLSDDGEKAGAARPTVLNDNTPRRGHPKVSLTVEQRRFSATAASGHHDGSTPDASQQSSIQRGAGAICILHR